jgi:hypothetical protein
MLVKINRNVSFPSVRSLSFSLSNLEPSSGRQIVLILVDLLPLPNVVVELLRLLVLKRSASCTLQLQVEKRDKESGTISSYCMNPLLVLQLCWLLWWQTTIEGWPEGL